MELSTDVNVTMDITMNTTNYSETDQGRWPLPVFHHLYIAVRVIEIVVALLGNVFVLRSIRQYDELRTKSNAFIANLAVVDLIAVSSAIGFYILNSVIENKLVFLYIMVAIKAFETLNNMCAIWLIGLER